MSVSAAISDTEKPFLKAHLYFFVILLIDSAWSTYMLSFCFSQQLVCSRFLQNHFSIIFQTTRGKLTEYIELKSI